jgi:DNA polymerase-3 subunit delta'
MLIGHQKQRDFLESKFKAQQLSHAYLFTGAEGIGKKMFAKEFAELIGCKFPDLMIAEAKNSELVIAKVREIQNFLTYRAYNGGFKAVIVDDAHLMNQEAQSCFLKTLEEPRGNTILFLISSKPDLLLPTIFSRCQTIKFFRPKDLPENKEVLEREQKIWSEVSKVLDSNLAEKFKYVKSIDFEKESAIEIIKVLQKHFRQKILENFSDKKSKKFLELSEEISNKLFFTNANPKLALEILLTEV